MGECDAVAIEARKAWAARADAAGERGWGGGEQGARECEGEDGGE